MEGKAKKVTICTEDNKHYYKQVHSDEHFFSLISFAKREFNGFLKVHGRTYLTDADTEFYCDPAWINVDKILYFRFSE